MTEYVLGDEVPRGGDAVIDFTIKVNGVPTEPSVVTVKWKDSSGATIETDTLAGGTVYRPTGSTAQNDPGHFRAKWTVPGAQALGSGYTVTVEGTVSGEAFGPNTLKSFEVVLSAVTTTVGGPYFCTNQDVKDYLTLNGQSLPSQMTDAKIDDKISLIHHELLARFRKPSLAELSDLQVQVGKLACAMLTAADLLLAVNKSEDATRVVDFWRKRANEAVDRSRGIPTEGNTRRLRSWVT